jgi:hypothetical protein
VVVVLLDVVVVEASVVAVVLQEARVAGFGAAHAAAAAVDRREGLVTLAAEVHCSARTKGSISRASSSRA